MNAASTIDEVKQSVVGMVLEDTYGDRDALVLTLELYTLAARQPAFRHLTHDWMMRSQKAFERHFEPEVARQLAALVEGLAIHRAFEPHEDDPRLVMDALDKLLWEAKPLTRAPARSAAGAIISGTATKSELNRKAPEHDGVHGQ